MGVVVDIIGAAGFAVLIIAVHEHGHRLAALFAGVPRHDVRVVLDGRPPHTALWDGDRWLAPDDGGYQTTFRRHQPDARWAWVYIAGGLVVETAAAAIAAMLLVVVGADEIAVVLAASTFVLFIVYLAGDLALTWRRRAPAGDHSALWQLYKRATVALVSGAAVVKTATLLVAW